MKLSDAMGAADLAIYAEVALVLFFVAFAVVFVRALWPGSRQNWDRLEHLPLDEDQGLAERERSAP